MHRRLSVVILPSFCLLGAAAAIFTATFPSLAIAQVGQSSGAPSASATANLVTQDTPSGAGDPGTIVCRAPQPTSGGNERGPYVCLRNREWLKAAMNGKDIAPDGKTLIDRPAVANPKGEGDPDAVTCRSPVRTSSKQDWVQHFGPEICRTNRFWAELIKNHQIVDAQGVVMAQRRPIDYYGQNPGYGTDGFTGNYYPNYPPYPNYGGPGQTSYSGPVYTSPGYTPPSTP